MLKLKQTNNVGVVKLEVLLFFLLWLTYGLTINSDNLYEYNLQQIGVEALVERGQFYLDGSQSPYLYPRADVFLHEGRKYAAKQPGQSMAGAVAYFPLHALGFSYVKNYFLTSALITFLTASLATAISGVAVFRVARALTKNSSTLFWSLATALAYGLATNIFPYAGLAHHDALGSAYLMLAFYLVFRFADSQFSTRAATLTACGVGILLGFTVTTSMLTFFMAVTIGFYFCSLRKWNLIPFFLSGVLAGLSPLFVYNAVSFGNPFLLPNLASDYSDTFFRFEVKNFADKLVFYSSMLVLYTPIVLLGLFGASYFPREFKRASMFRVMACLIVVLITYVFNIETEGDCQYGPRYLLPVMSYACIGLVGYSYLSTDAERLLAGAMVVVVGLFAFLINLVGAVQGVMYCPIERYAFWSYLSAMQRGEIHDFPLASWLFIPLTLCGVLFVREISTHRRMRREDSELAST